MEWWNKNILYIHSIAHVLPSVAVLKLLIQGMTTQFLKRCVRKELFIMRNFQPGKQRSQGLGLSCLTDDELFDLHLATLEVLEKTGLFIEAEEAMAVFEGAGADVDRQKKIVKIPPYLVEDAIRSAPSKILLAGRDPKNDKVLEAGRVHFTNFSEGIEVVDPYTGQRRPPVKADLANAA
jgi:trimethylamine--corrinoid protein Co-methyltransferase